MGAGADTATPRDEVPPLLRTAGEWCRVALSISGVGAFVLVATARTGLGWFYGHFDATPEELGLDRATVLVQTAASGAIVALGAAAIGLGASRASRLARSRLGKSTTRPGARRKQGRPAPLDRTALTVALLILLVYFVVGLASARQSLDRVRAGRSTDRQLLAHGEVVATCVQLWWTQPELGPLFAVAPGSRFVLLGRSAGIDVYYDPRAAETIRVPSSSVTSRTCRR